MKILEIGNMPLNLPEDWKVTVRCREVLQEDEERDGVGCEAVLEATQSDLQVFKWVQDCGYKGRKYYCAFVQCPCCSKKVLLERNTVHPFLLKNWETELGFKGYAVPRRRVRPCFTW